MIEASAATTEQLWQQLSDQQLLLNVVQHLAVSFDLNQSLRSVVDNALQLTKAESVRLILQDLNEPQVVFAGPLAEQFAALDDSIITLAQQSDDAAFPHLPAENSSFAPLPGQIKSLALWTLQFEGAFLGVLWLGFSNPTALPAYKNTLLKILVDQTAIAVINSRSLRKAEDERQWLEAVLGSTSDPVLVVDTAGKLSLLNHAAETVLDIQSDHVLYQPISSILASYPRLRRFFEDSDALAEGEEWNSPDGRTFSPRLSKVEAQGKPGSFVLILRDITNFIRLHKNQEEFVRLVSHDMRSPLTSMRGFASLLSMTGELNERQTEFAEKIQNGITHMAALVDNIQDAGRWDPDTGYYEMSREPADITAIIRDIAANQQAIAEKQQVTIAIDISPAVPIVNIDKLMIERALTNLVSNAIKYSPDGGDVTIAAAVKDESILLSVCDTGLGIAPEHIPNLFQRGGRVVTQAIKKHRIKGSGLGLFIVRSVARRHGGDAWVESKPGQGSCFYFSLPLSGSNLVGGARGQ